MNRRNLARGVAGILGVTAALQSTAALAVTHPPKVQPQQVTATFQGVVNAGSIDTLGAFGLPGADISGDAFTASFVVNEKQAHSVLQSATQSYYFGPVVATLTINGVSLKISDPYDQALSTNYLNGYQYYADAFQATSLTHSETMREGFQFDISLPLVFANPPDYHSYALSGAQWNPVPNDPGNFNFGGSFLIAEFPSHLFFESFYLESTELTVTSVNAPSPPHISAAAALNAPVPEPATWAMMLLGAGGLGAAARRRRRAGAVAA